MVISTCKNVTTDHAKPLKVLFYWLLNREEKWANIYGGQFPTTITNMFKTFFFWLPKQGKGGEVEIRVEKRKTKMRPWKAWGLLSQLCNENLEMCWCLNSNWSSEATKSVSNLQKSWYAEIKVRELEWCENFLHWGKWSPAFRTFPPSGAVIWLYGGVL